MTALQKLKYLTEQDYLAFELTADMRHVYMDDLGHGSSE